ncbi:MAG: GAF domain-containing protein [Candidatus Latescibacterota bacterium]|nr:GAF domain-containing protein [Candidatus Latescibacterota bacterium]
MSQVLVLGIAGLSLIELAWHRDRARLEIAFVLLSLAIAAAAQLWGGGSPFAQLATELALVAHPYLLVRLLDRFRPLPKWLPWTAVGVMVASWATWTALLFTPPVYKIYAGPAIAVLFSAALLYAVAGLVTGARLGQGIDRRRVILVGIGAALFAVVVALRMSQADSSSPTVATIEPALASCIPVLYYLGFLTPPWLSRSWQHRELLDFLRTASGRPEEQTEVILTRLCQVARHAVGGEGVAFAHWIPEEGRLDLDSLGERALVGGPIPDGILVNEYWKYRRPFVDDRRGEVRQACHRLAPGLQSEALIGIPVVTHTRVYGLVLVFLRRGPLFPNEDLRLLTLFAENSGSALDYADRIRQLRELGAQHRPST